MVGILVVDKGHHSAHDILNIMAQSRRNGLEQVEQSIKSVERPEDWDIGQAGVAEQLADDGVVQDGEGESNLRLIIPDGTWEMGEELAAAGLEDEISLDCGDALVLGSGDGVEEPAFERRAG